MTFGYEIGKIIENRDDFLKFMPIGTNGAITSDGIDYNTLCYRGLADAYVEEKFDGSLYMARFRDQSLRFISRRTSAKTGKPVDKTQNLPHLNRVVPQLAGTLLIGEIVSPTGKFLDSAGTMNCSPDKAIARQEANGWLQYIVFDCVWYCGKDLRGHHFKDRVKYRDQAVKEWKKYCQGYEQLSTSKIWAASDAEKIYWKILSRGGEGIMIKAAHLPYGKGVYKVKKMVDVSAVITGMVPGKGKYDGKVGALKFSVYRKSGELQEIGQCSGMTDEIRDMFSHEFKKYMGKVIDVRFQPFDDPGSWKASTQRLRHPRFVKLRPDVNPKECTVAKVKSDMLRFTK